MRNTDRVHAPAGTLAAPAPAMQAAPLRWGTLAALALFAGPAAAQAGNAVVIDFDQGRLILGWLGLWLVAALTFMVCADKRIRLMARLADHLRRRAQQRASDRADAAVLALARDDPRALADLRAAIDIAWARSDKGAQLQAAPVAASAREPLRTAKPPRDERPRHARGLRVAPLPGMPNHLQYLPG